MPEDKIKPKATAPEDPPAEAPVPPEAPEDEEEQEQAAPEPEAVPIGFGADFASMMDRFVALMEQREQRIMAQLEERLTAYGLPSPNGVHRDTPAELASEPGKLPPDFRGTSPQAGSAADVAQSVAAQARQRPQPRTVAFIPKEDAFNPRHTTFKTWINGRELRGKRGQVMILELGHGLDLARNGHGNCVDIAAMQGIGSPTPIDVPQAPELARPDTWDGLPLSNKSTVPVGR